MHTSIRKILDQGKQKTLLLDRRTFKIKLIITLYLFYNEAIRNLIMFASIIYMYLLYLI